MPALFVVVCFLVVKMLFIVPVGVLKGLIVGEKASDLYLN